jgi:hypothetical protein
MCVPSISYEICGCSKVAVRHVQGNRAGTEQRGSCECQLLNLGGDRLVSGLVTDGMFAFAGDTSTEKYNRFSTNLSQHVPRALQLKPVSVI